jgi:transposase
MQADLKATGAALLSQDLRKQFRRMHEVDGCSVEEIAQMFSVPELIVQSVLDGSANKPAPATQTNGEPESEYAETLARVRTIEDQLRDAESEAVQTLSELNTGAESEAIRYNAAKTIIEIRAGKLRPDKPTKHQETGLRADDFRSIMQDALGSI